LVPSKKRRPIFVFRPFPPYPLNSPRFRLLDREREAALAGGWVLRGRQWAGTRIILSA